MNDTDQLSEIAFEAYQYLYPLVIMDVTRRQATNVVDTHTTPMRAPHNQFAHFRSYPAGGDRDVVRFNFDTLYSFAWLDVREEPVVVSVPDSGGRYYLTPMLDMWTDVFAVPGTRTTGGRAYDVMVTGPGWHGDAPDGVTVISSPTSYVWVMGRTQTNGPDDFANVHAFQDRYQITPLSAHGSDSTPLPGVVDPTVDDHTEPLVQVNSMSASEFLSTATRLLAENPPHFNDQPILAQMEQLGWVPGTVLEFDKLDPTTRAAIEAGAAAALVDLAASVTDGSIGKWTDGWMTIEGGSYGTDYRRRAMVALAGLGCNLPEDALYPGTATDADGQPLDGSNRYILHFDAEQIPQARAFWSLTMYDHEGFHVANQIDRFALGDRDPIRFNDDGSLDLYLQADNPGHEREDNWLPTPRAGTFQPMLRIYSPAPHALRHGLRLPAIERVEAASTTPRSGVASVVEEPPDGNDRK